MDLTPSPTSVYILDHGRPFNPASIVAEPYGTTPSEYRHIAFLNDRNGLSLTDIALLFADHSIPPLPNT